MESVAVFLDYANINRAAKDKCARLDYKQLLTYLSEGRFLIDAHCYVPLDPRNSHRLDGAIQELWESGYIVNTKLGTLAGNAYKCNFDIEITMDILRVAYQVKPAIIVLASGDRDFVPLVLELRRSGIRVEVASFNASAAPDMVLKCSGFISLDHYLEQPYPESPLEAFVPVKSVNHPTEQAVPPNSRADLIAQQDANDDLDVVSVTSNQDHS